MTDLNATIALSTGYLIVVYILVSLGVATLVSNLLDKNQIVRPLRSDIFFAWFWGALPGGLIGFGLMMLVASGFKLPFGEAGPAGAGVFGQWIKGIIIAIACGGLLMPFWMPISDRNGSWTKSMLFGMIGIAVLILIIQQIFLATLLIYALIVTIAYYVLKRFRADSNAWKLLFWPGTAVALIFFIIHLAIILNADSFMQMIDKLSIG